MLATFWNYNKINWTNKPKKFSKYFFRKIEPLLFYTVVVYKFWINHKNLDLKMNVDTKRGVRVSQRISKLDFRMRKQLWISPRAMNKRQT